MRIQAVAVGVALGLMTTFQVQAEAPVTSSLSAPVATPAPAAAVASDLQSVLEVMYTDIEKLKQNRSVTTSNIAAVGTGAGLGYLVGGLVTGGIVAPAVSTLATTVGFAQPTAAAMGTTIATMGTFAATYAGGVVGDALIE
jgi:hypothetical protein